MKSIKEIIENDEVFAFKQLAEIMYKDKFFLKYKEPVTTCDQFNEKYLGYLSPGFEGITINNKKVLDYLDREFEKEIQHNPHFKYKQIKLKFNQVRIYAKSKKVNMWKKQVQKLLTNER
jgi:hypothetical protein